MQALHKGFYYYKGSYLSQDHKTWKKIYAAKRLLQEQNRNK